MPAPLPTDATGLTPAWLTTALSARHPGVRVASVEVLDATERTNHHLRLGLTYDVRAGAPGHALLQAAAARSRASRAHRGRRHGHARGALLQRGRALAVDARAGLLLRGRAGDDGSFVLLLEDLAARGAAISDGSWAVPGRLARAALAELAELHVRYEEPARLAAVAPWATSKRGKTPDFVIQTLRYVIDHCARPAERRLPRDRGALHRPQRRDRSLRGTPGRRR